MRVGSSGATRRWSAISRTIVWRTSRSAAGVTASRAPARFVPCRVAAWRDIRGQPDVGAEHVDARLALILPVVGEPRKRMDARVTADRVLSVIEHFDLPEVVPTR